MRNLVVTFIGLCALASSVCGEDSLMGGAGKELVIGKRIVVPTPAADWSWTAGPEMDAQGVKVNIYICKAPDGKSALQFVVFHESLNEDKETFAKGLVEGGQAGARKAGFQLVNSATERTDTPWPGSIKYRAVLTRSGTKLYMSGYVAFGEEIHGLQYAGPSETPAYLDRVAQGIRRLHK
jgi:hypothetical protein